MSKFKIKLKVTGLELEIEGAREDVPMLARNLGSQLTGVIMPAANIADGRFPSLPGGQVIDVTPRAESGEASGHSNPRRRKGTARSGNAGTTARASSTTEVSIQPWQHNPTNWGTPRQTWLPRDKAVWLLYVARAEAKTDKASAIAIAKLFNQMFKEAGLLDGSNLLKALRREKTAGRVAEDTTTAPTTWFLVESGIKHAEGLVKAARGEPAPQV